MRHPYAPRRITSYVRPASVTTYRERQRNAAAFAQAVRGIALAVLTIAALCALAFFATVALR